MEGTFKEYENYLKTHTRLAPKTIKGNMEFVRRINNMSMSSDLIKISDLNATWYEKNIILNKDLSENTKRLYLLAAKGFYEYLRFYGMQSFNPVVGLAIPHNIQSMMHKSLSVDQIQTLFDCCRDIREEVILFFLYFCGLRASELIGLDIDDIDFKKRIVWIRHGKGNKMRFVPFNAERLIPLWERYIKIYEINSDTYAICNHQGRGRLTYKGLRHLIFKLYGLTGIRFTAHDLRHSFAMHEVDKNINPFVLKQAMGHASMSTTEIYVRSSSVRACNEFKRVDLTDNINLDSGLKVC